MLKTKEKAEIRNVLSPSMEFPPPLYLPEVNPVLCAVCCLMCALCYVLCVVCCVMCDV
jgi:hypothetical protein